MAGNKGALYAGLIQMEGQTLRKKKKSETQLTSQHGQVDLDATLPYVMYEFNFSFVPRTNVLFLLSRVT